MGQTPRGHRNEQASKLMTSRAENDKPPRVLLLSQRALIDQVANACLYEFEDCVAGFDRADLVGPRRDAVLPGKFYKLARRLGVPRELARGATLRHRLELPEREYDLLLAVLDSYRQVASVHATRELRRRCRRAICFIPEIWPKDFATRNEILELFDLFDHIFIGVDHCVDALEKIIGRPCSNMHPAVDVMRFCPQRPTPRVIDVSYIGRRSAVTHAALLRLAEEDGLFYYHDTTKSLRVADHAGHRRMLASLIQRSRYFIANYAKIDRPDQTGHVQEVGYRFFEGAAAGAVMLGQPPANAAYPRLFPYPDAVIEAPFDAPGIADLIRALDADPERLERVRTSHLVHALRHHDWVHRYAEMLAAVGLPPTAAMAERRARLEAQATRLEQGIRPATRNRRELAAQPRQ
jgi:hypothetical protein